MYIFTQPKRMHIKYRNQLGELLEHFGLTGDAVEIGVAEGRLSQVLIHFPSITKLYLIDAWRTLNQTGDGSNEQDWHDKNFAEVQERVSKLNHKAVFLRGMSYEMIPKIPNDSLVLAYIDCDHSYEGCLGDLFRVYDKVKKGGIIAGHDYLNFNPIYGVNRAVKEFVNILEPKPQVHVIEEDETPMASFWFQK